MGGNEKPGKGKATSMKDLLNKQQKPSPSKPVKSTHENKDLVKIPDSEPWISSPKDVDYSKYDNLFEEEYEE